jgi:hypothetical protein
LKSFETIDELLQELGLEDQGNQEIQEYRTVLKNNSDVIDLLRFLEKVNPCGQVYYLNRGIILVSYLHHLNLLNFTKKMSLKAKVRIIGLPISLSGSGILTKRDLNPIENETVKTAIHEVLEEMKGLGLVLNYEEDLYGGHRTLSAFIFRNRFPDFQAYLDALRAPYRRKIIKVLERGKHLHFIRVPSSDFAGEHYSLYRSIMERTQNPLEILPIDFFKGYDAEIIEVRDMKSRLVGFVQLKGAGPVLYFMFCGFRKSFSNTAKVGKDTLQLKGNEDAGLDHIDLYYNMLLFIIRYGIENGYEKIEMGQTSEETKLKLGCMEVEKYLFLHHGNPILNAVLQKLSGRFSYKGYGTMHHVYRKEKISTRPTIGKRVTG